MKRLKKIRIKREKLFWIAITAVLLFTGFYFFGLSGTVFNTVKRTTLEKEINVLKHQISSLEFDLISEKNNINTELAYSLGFEKADDIKFIHRKSVATIIGAGSIQ